MPSIIQSVKGAVASAAKSIAHSWGGGETDPRALMSEIGGDFVGGIPVGKLKISTDSLYTVWRNHGDVFGAIRELGQGVGVAGWYWEDRTDPEKPANKDSIRRAEAIMTAKQTMRQFLKELVQDVSIAGNSYYNLEKNLSGNAVISLERLDPRTMCAVVDRNGVLKRWVQRVGGETEDFTPDEVAHFTLTNDPNSPVYGISPIEPILWELRTDLAAMVSNYALFQNDATPAAMYVFEEAMSDDDIQKAVNKIKTQIKGAENRHKTLGMKGLKEIKTVSITNKDMEFTVLRGITTEKVCAAYGVPKSILGYTDAINLSNGQEQSKKFWESTIEPLEEAIQEFINRKLLPALGIQDIKIVFETRAFDNREWDEASTRADLQLGVFTINEVREMRGKKIYDVVTEGDIVNKPIIYGGLGARPAEDIGIDMEDGFDAIVDEPAAEKALQRLDHLGRKYEQTKSERRATAQRIAEANAKKA